MSKIDYLVRRSRSGRFNFTLISEAGRIAGTVVVPSDGQSDEERERQAHMRICKLAEAFALQQLQPPTSDRPRRIDDIRLSDIKTW